MLKHLRPAIVMIVAMTAVTGVAYPLAVTGIAQALFPDQAAGSLVRRGDQIVGSSLIGQSFRSERYFHGRPSATSAADPADPTKTVPAPYNAASSAGSNLGPTNAALIARVTEDVARRKAENPGQPVPVDLVTTTASGLDPHLSRDAALFQVPRIARARGMAEADLRLLVAGQTEGRLFGLIGEPRVNVVALNLALDRAAAR
ncbi:K(+)-transporting ATPase subunit C [Stella sp.]|uniref:K(+)-transporting ATPase subunit C n=1 Tax=Stella sp. TaxID=2912054 RepID=UPI0035B31F52